MDLVSLSVGFSTGGGGAPVVGGSRSESLWISIEDAGGVGLGGVNTSV